MTTLPPVANTSLDGANVISAYEVCLEFESLGCNKPTDLLHARILGYLILHIVDPLARDEVVNAIHSCGQDYSELSRLGETFLNGFIRPFRKFNDRTPASSKDSSPISFSRRNEKIKVNILEAPKDHKDAKNQALIRDGCRCVVTGLYDMRAAEFSISVEEAYQPGFPVNTQCAHIIPESTYFGVKMGEVKDNKARRRPILAWKHY